MAVSGTPAPGRRSVSGPGPYHRAHVTMARPTQRFAGRVAVVTGAGAGLGRAVALRLAAEGAGVLVADLDGARAGAVAREVEAAGGRAHAVAADVAEPAAVEGIARTARDRLGPVDLLVANAARAEDPDLLATTPEGWDRQVAVTLRGPFLCARAVLPGMRERRRGAIVAIGSVNGVGAFGNEAYSAAKAGLASLVRSIAVNYGPDGVRANLVVPGTLRTAAWDERLARDPDALERVARWYPLGRVGEVHDVVGPVLFLLSDEAAWVTGAALVVDGGLLAGNGPMTRDILGSVDRGQPGAERPEQGEGQGEPQPDHQPDDPP